MKLRVKAAEYQHATKGVNILGGFLKFEKMITPIFIQIMFWLGVIGSIFGGFGAIGYGIISSSGNFLMVIGGVFLVFIGPILVRIYCEMLIVVFKMQAALIAIRDTLEESNDTFVQKEEIG